MKQSYTSAATSINAHKLPRLFQNIHPARNSLLFDYGCGKYTEHIRAAFPGVVYCPYDPYNQPRKVNSDSAHYIRAAMSARYPVTVACSNVLNVIDSDDAITAIARDITRIVDATRGTAYVTVYEGDRSGKGRRTGPDQWQRNEPLRAYLRFFPASATIEKNMIVIRSGEV